MIFHSRKGSLWAFLVYNIFNFPMQIEENVNKNQFWRMQSGTWKSRGKRVNTKAESVAICMERYFNLIGDT